MYKKFNEFQNLSIDGHPGNKEIYLPLPWILLNVRSDICKFISTPISLILFSLDQGSLCRYLAFPIQKCQNKQFQIFSTFRIFMESYDHGLSEYLYYIQIVPFILTQDRREVTHGNCFCAKLGFLFSNKITRSRNSLTGGPGWMQTWFIMNDMGSLEMLNTKFQGYSGELKVQV